MKHLLSFEKITLLIFIKIEQFCKVKKNEKSKRQLLKIFSIAKKKSNNIFDNQNGNLISNIFTQI